MEADRRKTIALPVNLETATRGDLLITLLEKGLTPRPSMEDMLKLHLFFHL